MNYRNEIWKEFPLNYQHENFFKIEFSNYGRIKTYNSHFPEGNIIKGTLQGGFPMIRCTLFKKRKEHDVLKIEEIQIKIDEFNQKLKDLGTSKNVKEEKEIIRSERDIWVKKRMALNKKIDKKRKIYIGILIHKAVAELFLEKPENKNQKFVIHKDFDKTNNNFENLAWANQEEINARSKQHPKNILHAFKKQFEPKIPEVKNSKLTENEVLRIKLRLKKGDSMKKLSQQFGVSDMQIHRIKTGENWSHVKLLEEILEENK